MPTLAPTPGPLPRILLEPSTWVPFAWALFAAVFYLSNHLAITADAVLLIAPALTACVLAVLPTIWPRGFAAGVPLAMVYGVVTSALLTVPFLRAETARAEAYAALADAVGPLPARDRVALEPAGEVILLSRHPVVDLQGTLDPAALAFRWDPDDERRVPWAQAKGARYMVLDHLPEPGSTLVWSRDLPAERAGFGDGTPQPADRLLLWHLPPAPTLPPPALGLPETD